jgi:hypothetical protein
MVVPEPSIDVDHFYFMADYRKIWKDSNGPIPIDEFGRSYEIHHIDGDHYNNEISNLIHLTISDHKKIHSDKNKYRPHKVETIEKAREQIKMLKML